MLTVSVCFGCLTAMLTFFSLANSYADFFYRWLTVMHIFLSLANSDAECFFLLFAMSNSDADCCFCLFYSRCLLTA